MRSPPTAPKHPCAKKAKFSDHGGQDFIDISDLGISSANFATSVTIKDLGRDTLVIIGNDLNPP